MMQLGVTVAIWILGLVFAAGGAWKLLQESRRHTNGLGMKFNRAEKERQDQYTRLALALMAIAATAEEKRIVGVLLSLGEEGKK